jgi:uncharacterized repeat protein (TIGR01451 family)
VLLLGALATLIVGLLVLLLVELPVAAQDADLILTNTHDPHPVSVGGTLTYTLVVNNSTNRANKITITDILPNGVTMASSKNHELNRSLARRFQRRTGYNHRGRHPLDKQYR